MFSMKYASLSLVALSTLIPLTMGPIPDAYAADLSASPSPSIAAGHGVTSTPSPSPDATASSPAASTTTPPPFHASVLVTAGSTTRTIVVTSAETLGDALTSIGVDPTACFDSHMQSITLSQRISNGQTLHVYTTSVTETSTTVPIAFTTNQVKTPTLFEGQKKVSRQGRPGSAILTKETTVNPVANGENASGTTNRQMWNVVTSPIPQIVLVGTKKRTQHHSTQPSPSQSPTATDTSASSPSPSNDASVSTYTSPLLPFQPSPSATTPHRPVSYDAGAGDAWGRQGAREVNDLINNNRGNRAVLLALGQVGKPYVWGATGPSSFDCSGLIYWIYSIRMGRPLPRTALAQGVMSQPIGYNDLRPGDLLYTSSHIVMYVGDGRVVHAANPRRGVVISDLPWFISHGFQAVRVR